MANEVSNDRRSWVRRTWVWFAHGGLKNWIVVFLVPTVIATVLVIAVPEITSGPDSYRIYVVGNFGQARAKQVWETLSKHKEQLPKFGGLKLELVREDDRGDPDDAQRISESLAARNDVLLVIGHMASTQTYRALPGYFEKATPPIPVILPTETNPHLMPPHPSDDSYFPAFRLSPMDDRQAETAAKFAIDKGASSFWVVQDIRSNDRYSAYLVEKFIEEVQTKFGKVVLWSTNDSIPSVDAIRALKIDCVFFAGSWQNSLILIQQVKAMSQLGKKPMIILTDSSASDFLLKRGAHDVEGVFLTYPMKAREYVEKGFTIYGNEAFELLDQLIEEGNAHFADLAQKEGGWAYTIRRIFRVKSVADARRVLGTAMEKAVRDQQKFTLADGVEAQFRAPEGVRQDATFYVWKVCNASFLDESEACRKSDRDLIASAVR